MAETNPQPNKPESNPAVAASATANKGAEAVRRGTEAVEQGGRATSEVLRRGAEVSAEAARRGGEAGAEAMQRAGTAASENFRRGTQAVAESQQQIVQDAAEKFEEVSRKVAQAVRGTTEDLRTLTVLPNAAKGGLQDLHQSVTGLVEGVVRTNLRATQELFRLVNPSPFVELQQRFVSEYVNAVMEGSATLVRATRRTAEETLRPLEQQIEQRQQASRSGQAFQNAAE
jgi:hypothetical protein